MHIGFILILSCAFTLPFIFTFILDSARYSLALEVEAVSGYRIYNAIDSDIPYFDKIDGIQASITNDTIVLEIDDLYYDDVTLRELLLSTISEIDNDRLMLEISSYDTSTDDKFAAQWILVIIAFISISMLIIKVAYNAHIGNFKTEMGILESIGASLKQIKNIYYFELILSFIASIIISFIASYFSTYLLFKYFLQVESVAGGNMSLLVFHMNWGSLLFLIFIEFVFISFIFVFKFKQATRGTIVGLLAISINDVNIKHYNSTISSSSHPIKTVSNLLLKRSNKVFVYSLSIIVPTLTLLFFLFNYSLVYMDDLNKDSEYDVLIRKNPSYDNDGLVFESFGFSKNEIDWVSRIENISDIELHTLLPEGEYVILPESTIAQSNGYPFIEIGDSNYLSVSIHSISELIYNNNSDIMEIADADNSIAVALNRNSKYTSYEIGDTLTLYKRNLSRIIDGHEHEHEHEHDETITEELTVLDFTEIIDVSIVALIDMPYDENALALYFSDEQYDVFLDGRTPNIMGINLDSGSNDFTFITALKSFFDSPDEVSIQNEIENTRNRSRTSTGILFFYKR